MAKKKATKRKPSSAKPKTKNKPPVSKAKNKSKLTRNQTYALGAIAVAFIVNLTFP